VRDRWAGTLRTSTTGNHLDDVDRSAVLRFQIALFTDTIGAS